MAISDRTGMPSALDAFGFHTLDGLVAAVTVGQFIYVFAYNSLPDGPRLAVAGVLLVAQILLCTWAMITRPASWSIVVVVALAIEIICWPVSPLVTGMPIGAWDDLIHRLALALMPYICAIWLLTFSARLPYRLLSVIVLASSVLAGALALTGEPFRIVDTVRLASFTGGEGYMGLHPSAYFIVLAMFIIDSYRRTGSMSGKLSIPILGFLLVVLVGYQVRTTLMMLGVYAIGLAWRSRWRPIVLESGLLALGIALICVAAAFMLTDVLSGSEEWGSGRVGNYQFRMALVMQRDLVPLMFGTGLGSDDIVTPVWWWMAGDSHSDLMHTLIETGVVGVLGLATFLYGLWLRIDSEARPLFLSLLVCTTISNGLLNRPDDFFFLIVAIAVAEKRLAPANHSPAAPRPDRTPFYSVGSRMS